MEREVDVTAIDNFMSKGKLTVHSEVAVRDGREEPLDQNLSDVKETSRIYSHSACLGQNRT